MSNPGANLIAGVTSQQDNRFRKRQQELDEAWRDRQMDLQQSQLDFRKDQWNTTRDWQQDIIDRENRQKAFDSELASNYYNELQEQQAYDLSKEAWEKDILGEQDISFWQMFGLGGPGKEKRTYRDWIDQYNRQADHWLFGMDYEDVHPEGVKMPERDRKALFDLVESGEFTPEQIEKIKEMHLKSPSTKGMTTKGLIDLYRVPEWMSY